MPSSGQGGPCCHCGRTNSCCWRRGPAAKPILCNACGSRYLVKRSLEGYQPLQTRREAGSKQQEAGQGTKQAAAAARRAAPTAVGRVAKPKRAAPKRSSSIDSDAWNSEVEESEASDACMTDDSAATCRASARLASAGTGGATATATAGAAAAQQELLGPEVALLQQGAAAAAVEGEHSRRSARSAAMASKLQLSYITSQAQLKELGSADFSSIAGAFFASSLRLKPRKPVVVNVSAVW